MLSYVARALRISRARSRSYFGTNRIISPMFAPIIGERESAVTVMGRAPGIQTLTTHFFRRLGCDAAHQVMSIISSALAADLAAAFAASTCEALSPRRS